VLFYKSDIEQLFEKSLATLLEAPHFEVGMVLEVIPKLMNSAVVSFMNGTTHTSERAVHGYFALHRLFLWAVTAYRLHSLSTKAQFTRLMQSQVSSPRTNRQ
jgi:hypothetical protein